MKFILPDSFDIRKPKPKRIYKNPVYLAKEWQELLDSCQFKSKAELGRHIGVSRVRVVQVLDLLKLSPEVISKVSALGKTFKTRFMGEKTLRPLVCLTPAKQMEKVNLVLDKK